MPFVYRDDGLMVGWDKNLPRKQLGVEVWQILIDGKKPKRLPGSQDDKIVVETVETETVPLVKAVASNDLKAVTALLAKGADANVKNSVEIPVLVMAIRRGPPHGRGFAQKQGRPQRPRRRHRFDPPLGGSRPDGTRPGRHRQDAAGRGCGRECGESEGGRSPRGHTPLMIAAADGSEDLVQLFLTKAQTSRRRRRDGFTALSMAKWSKSEDNRGVIRKLVAAGAKK